MSIQKLPQESVRSLGSAQVITTPLTVFKELIENALDAKATTISLESSPDLLSYFVVKDNGTGVPPDDRPLMAAPHCTSKIQNYEDIAEVATLGFRGEALASLAAISGNLTISTRTDKEPVGVACDIGKDGKISRQSTIPMPRGTTIKVANIFANVPVRKASIEKTAARILLQIRPLLVSYVLTHPHVRFSFKLVAPPTGHSNKKKIDTKYDVIFSSSKSVEDAFLKSVGKDAAGSGTWLHEVSSETNDEALEFKAFLVRPDAETDNMSRKGIYISFQQRPLSIERKGFAKQVYALYKKYVKNCSSYDLHGVSEPFLYLDITANRSTVDVNIEPAKDDVLFVNNEIVLMALNDFFSKVYGHLAEETSKDNANKTPSRGRASGDIDDFNVLLSGRSRGTATSNMDYVARDVLPTGIGVSHQVNNVETRPSTDTIDSEMLPANGDEASLEPQKSDKELVSTHANDNTTSTESRWRFNMYDSELPLDDGDAGRGGKEVPTVRDDAEVRESDDEPEVDRIATSNPFTIAKMNAKIQSTASHTKYQSVSGNQSTPTVNRMTSRTPFLTPRSSHPSPTQDNLNLDRRADATPATHGTAVNVHTPVSTGKGLWYPSFGSNPMSSVGNRSKRKSYITMNQTSPINDWLVKGASKDGDRSTDNIMQTPTVSSTAPDALLVDMEQVHAKSNPGITSWRTFESAKEMHRRNVGRDSMEIISSDEDVTSIAQSKTRRDNEQKTSADDVVENEERSKPTNSPYKNRQNAARAALDSPVRSEHPVHEKTKKKFRAPILPLETIPVKDQLHKVRLTLPRYFDSGHISRSRYLQDPLWYDDAIPILDELPDLARMIRDCLWRAKSSGLIKDLVRQSKEDTAQRIPDILQKSDTEHLRVVIEKTHEDEVAKLKVM